MISGQQAREAFKKINHWAGTHINPHKMEDGMGKSIVGGILNATTSRASTAGAVYGGAAGAVGGALSSDRNQHWYTGAAQGAFAGYQVTRGGLSGGAILGAGLGAAVGMAADDTSIMGGAFMGAMAGGPGRRYGSTALKAFRGVGGGKRGLGAGYRAVRRAASAELGLNASSGQQSKWLRDRGVTLGSTRDRTGGWMNTQINRRAGTLRRGKPPQRNQAAGSARPPKPTTIDFPYLEKGSISRPPSRGQAKGSGRPAKPVTVRPEMQRKWLKGRGVNTGQIPNRESQSVVNQMRDRTGSYSQENQFYNNYAASMYRNWAKNRKFGV